MIGGIGYDRILMLVCSILFLSVSIFFASSITGGEQIISRSLNFALLPLSTFISATALAILSGLQYRRSQKRAKILFIGLLIFLILAAITYPLHSQAKESYVSYSESYGSGNNFVINLANNEPSKTVKIFTEQDSNQALMKSQIDQGKYLAEYYSILSSDKYNKIYSNKYYSVFL
jgi:hypothetical protein